MAGDEVRLVGTYQRIGKAQGTHGLVLILQQFRLHGRTAALHGHEPLGRNHLRTEVHHILGGTLYINHPMVEQRRIDYRSHILTLGREGELLHHMCPVAQLGIVDTLVGQPQQQSPLGGVTQHLHPVGTLVEVSRRVGGNAFGNNRFDIRVGGVVKSSLAHPHLVLGEGSRLVGTDDRSRTHRLAGVHLAHQVVVGQHTLHAHGQTQGHTHGQPLGHGHHDNGHGNHGRREQIAAEAEPVEHRMVGEVDDRAGHKDDSGNHITGLRDERCQRIELLVERSLGIVLDL